MRNRGCKHRPLWDLIVQPDKKKFEGKYLELVGKFFPRSVKTYKRGILVNRPRFKYWLSVGATPTKQV
jgi:small subunit ribosomal protein S16